MTYVGLDLDFIMYNVQVLVSLVTSGPDDAYKSGNTFNHLLMWNKNFKMHNWLSNYSFNIIYV